MNDALPFIADVDTACAERASRHLDTLTKPPGSLGRLEALAVSLAGITGEAFPRVSPPAVVVFAADHGVAAEGVSAFPQAVTARWWPTSSPVERPSMFLPDASVRISKWSMWRGQCIARRGVVHDRVRPGTANLAREAAMQRDEALAAIAAGRRAAERAQWPAAAA